MLGLESKFVWHNDCMAWSMMDPSRGRLIFELIGAFFMLQLYRLRYPIGLALKSAHGLITILLHMWRSHFCFTWKFCIGWIYSFFDPYDLHNLLSVKSMSVELVSDWFWINIMNRVTDLFMDGISVWPHLNLRTYKAWKEPKRERNHSFHVNPWCSLLQVVVGWSIHHLK